MAAAMQDPHTRFFVAEHPMMMFVALCVAHGASIWSRKATVDRTKFMRASLGFSLALGLVLAGIPWFRMGSRSLRWTTATYESTRFSVDHAANKRILGSDHERSFAPRCPG